MAAQVSEEALRFLARHRAERVGPLTDVLVATILGENAGYRGGTDTQLVPLSELQRSCHDNIDRILQLLADWVGKPPGVLADADREPAYNAARATGRRRAEQGLPLDDVLRSFRMGGRLIWEDLVEQAEHAVGGAPDAPTLAGADLRALGTSLWRAVDETSAQVALAYHRRVRAAVRADEQQRAELWADLLGGRAHEPGFAGDAARVLDLPVESPLLVVCAARLDSPDLEGAVAPHASAWIVRADGVVGLLALREDDPRAARAAVDDLARHEDVPVGCSGVLGGLADVERGHREARLALRTAGEPGLVAFDDRLPEALLLGAPDVAARLREDWLRGLLALPDDVGRALLATTAAWVAAGGSVQATAAAVPCHRNTVLNRMRRVEELTGVRLLDGAPPIELDLAVRAWQLGL